MRASLGPDSAFVRLHTWKREEAVKLAALRAQVESVIGSRFPSPFTWRQRVTTETLSTGISAIDGLTGGLPRGGLIEISGPVCSGRTSLLLSVLATLTRVEVCALVDARNAFDPYSAQAAGINLARLLWVRCSNIHQAFQATDLLLGGGGFGLVALDLSEVSTGIVRQAPLNVWFRFRRAIENTPTVLMVLEQEASAKTCASLVLQLGAEAAHWSQTPQSNVPGPLRGSAHTHLLRAMDVRVAILRSRSSQSSIGPVHSSCHFWCRHLGCSEVQISLEQE